MAMYWLHAVLTVQLVCRLCDKCELFAAACLRLGIPHASSSSQPTTPSIAAFLPPVLERHLASAIPGFWAMAHAPFLDKLSDETPPLHDLFLMYMQSPVTQSAIEVAHCRRLVQSFVL